MKLMINCRNKYNSNKQLDTILYYNNRWMITFNRFFKLILYSEKYCSKKCL